jgi:Na+-driven multidrug efflux pump
MLLSQPYVKKNFSLAWPLALNGLLMQSMLLIDTFMVSPLGEVPLAAMGISGTILAVLLAIQMALANGSQLVLSRAVGSQSQTTLSKAFWAGLLINGSVATLFWTLLTLFDQPLITALTDDSQLQIEIGHYLGISKYLVVLTAITQVMIALLNGLGKSKIPFKGFLIELPLNAGLSYCFIYGFSLTNNLSMEGLGVQGAAIGSVVGISARLLYLAMAIKRSPDVSLSRIVLNSAMLNNIKQHFHEIFPVAANVTILMLGANMYQLMYTQLDIYAYVAITLVAPWLRSGTQFVGSWSQSSAITISQAIGSKNLTDLSKNVNISIDIAVGISIVVAGLFAVMSLVIANVYPHLEESTYIALAAIAPLYIILPIARGYNTVHGNILRALGKTKDVFRINFIGQWVISIPLCAVLVLVFDCSVFWAFAVQPFEEIIRALPLRHLARKTLATFNQQAAEKLMYE